MTLNVVVWNENIHDQQEPWVRDIYPLGIHYCIADALNVDPAIYATTATLQEPEHGLSAERLAATDVLLWWGHFAHDQVSDEVVDRVQARVLEGMGLIVLHSAHFSRIFRRLMGTSCTLGYREDGEWERLWVTNPGHPIVQGIDRYLDLQLSEMYCEPFGIPNPDEVVFISNFAGGEVFRSGATWQRGNGRIFYFGPGHETFPIYHDPNVQQILRNAVHWAQPQGDPWLGKNEEIARQVAPYK